MQVTIIKDRQYKDFYKIALMVDGHYFESSNAWREESVQSVLVGIKEELDRNTKDERTDGN